MLLTIDHIPFIEALLHTPNTIIQKYPSNFNTPGPQSGYALLKIGKISRTCPPKVGTVFQLDKKEYAPGQTGVIKLSYTSGKSTGTIQKSIYVPANDKDNPRVKLSITGRLTDGTVFEARDTIKVLNKIGRKSPD